MKQRICLRCGHKWYPRKPGKPAGCPKCHSAIWDKPKGLAVAIAELADTHGFDKLDPSEAKRVLEERIRLVNVAIDALDR